MNFNSSLRFFPLLVLFSILTASSLHAQRQSYLDAAMRFVEQKREQWELSREDIGDMVVSDQFVSQHNGVNHFYFIQRYQGIEVHNAILGIHVTATGKLGFATSRFVPNLADKINTVQPALTPYDAVRRVASDLSLAITEPLRVVERNGSREITFHGGSVSASDIPVKLFFQPIAGTDEVRLVWNLLVDQIDSPDNWSIRVDALTGKILEKNNRTVYCSARKKEHQHGQNCSYTPAAGPAKFQPLQRALLEKSNTTSGTASYNVFPLPLENPLEGERVLLVDPHDPIASPYGWHDTDGQEGPEYSITRGNNAHVFLDLDDKDETEGDETDGGEDMVFDFPLDLSLEPEEYQDAANTQLFYMLNVMHDFAYHYGFDEASGNFQVNTYGRSGENDDMVEGQAQDGGNIKDDDHINNANFFTPPDGFSGRMQVYLWNTTTNNLLTVLAPDAIEGGYESSTASFGPSIDNEPLEGRVVEAYDNSTQPNLACNTIVNIEEVTGSIALVDRGSCFFKEKTYNVEEAGAIALVICNFEESVVGMGDTDDVPDVNIPTVMLKSSDCRLIRQFLNAGVDIRLVLPDNSGPTYLDGGLDNGLIAHEYGHGITTRLTGGGSQVDCLFNDEAMAEGWSDFFSLVLVAKEGDQGSTPVGMGSYVWNRRADGVGFRRLPYSTDMEINNFAYDDVIGQGTHSLGEVWTLTLWDLYWEMVDLYGFDDDLYFGTGGNNKAIQLMMDGLKLQACNPGFVDGRDAIIAADAILFDGAHECMIWEVFARRGIGWDAVQGLTTNQNDNYESFLKMPQCVKELKIVKTVDKDLINPGEDLEYTLRIANHTDAVATGVMISDIIPDGAVVNAASVSDLFPFTITDNTIVWEAGDIPSGQEFSLKYSITTSTELASEQLFYDNMESFGDNWIQQNLEGTEIWDLSQDAANSGEQSWFVRDSKNDNDQGLMLFDPLPVTGSQPVLRFYHKYETEPVEDGGIVQISTDGGLNWDFLDDKFFKHKYRRKIDYSAFAIPGIGGFWGSLQEFTPSYIDLSAYQGENIQVRFRFGSDGEDPNAVHPYEGWYVDDFEILDMLNYETEACISSENGGMACDRPDERGTVVDSRSTTAVSEIEALGAEVRVFPNPVKDELQVAIEAQRSGQLSLSLLSLEGKLLQSQEQMIHTGFNRTRMNVSDLPTGMYILRLSTAGEVATQKIIVD
ncbi:M36 family metallopeptidase [Flavilitoribacter nigricans]|uniref:DUF11 domain-containing protein n=1 Tax=Flavilitoribacter nigricans (strain ATCC 23147 / DSM 23189 / NBRC 102662 / NCIMB 1420 / SS-2) TaxID=1122177 RepID=A0A2D0NFC7_FLAN2|nr:M36 family metallopeptidase [Flavilitoribacter nigricans]PHN07204.1 hypothetical protein CRP01_08255 [Flavilitoribacter nigricans DSM 23189 = NBRC 102662]